MLKSLTRLTRGAAFAAAFLAGVAGFASSAQAAASAHTTVALTPTLQAPYVTTTGLATFAANMNARFRVVLTDGTAGNSDGYELIAAFLNSSNNFVGFSRTGSTTGATSLTKTMTVNLAPPVSATQVIFFAVARGDETGANSADDTFLGGTAANRIVILLTPNNTATGAENNFLATTIDVGAGNAFGTTFASGITGAQVQTIAGLVAVNTAATRQPLSSTYAGPVLTTATKATTATPLDMRLTFNATLSDSTGFGNVADNTNVAAQINVQNAAVNSHGGNLLLKGALTAGQSTFKLDNNSAAFVNSPDNVDIVAGTVVTDRAGNGLALITNFSPITTYAEPGFASTGTAKVMLTGGNAVDTLGERNELNSLTGTGNNGETFILTVRMAENFDGTGVDNVDDIALTPTAVDGVTTVSSAGANGNTFAVTITLNAEAQAIRVNQTTGVLEWTSDDTVGTPTWTPITLGLTVGAGPLATADGGTLSAANTPVSAYNSLSSTPTVATLDALNGTTAGVDGILDGVKVDFVEDVATANSTGFSIFDRVTPATTAAVTVAVNSLDSSIVEVTAPQATLYGAACNAGFLETSQTCGTHANTASTDATPIPYDFSLTNATMTYARVYNSSTGNLKVLPNIASGGTISDGAAPVVVKVARNLGETNDPEGSLVIYTSEGMAANPAIGFVKTQNGSLALDILNNVDDGDPASTTGARTQTSFTVGGITYNVANNTATFSNVDNDVLSALTAVGVTGGNSGGNGFQDAAGNFSGEHTISPDAAAVITTLAPTLDQAVVVLDSSRMITHVLAILTENVTSNGTNLNQRFALCFGGAAITPTGASVTGNIVSLTLPGSGVSLRQIENSTACAGGNAATVAYTTSGTTFLDDSNDNILASFAATKVQIPLNSDNLFSMEIRGTVYTTGTTAVSQGTLVRADLMRFAATRVIDRGSATVPCNCAGSTKDVALTFDGGTSAFDSALYQAQIRGDTSIPVWFRVTHDGANGEQGTGVAATIYTAAPGGSSGQQTDYLASMNVSTGAITSSGSSVSGSVVFRTGPISYTAVESARYAVVNGTDGKFRVNIGTNSAPLAGGDQVVILSVRQNGSTTSAWVPVTFADASLAGYIPFNQDIKNTVAAGVSDSPFIDFSNTTGANGTLVATFDLSKIAHVDLADTGNYQLVGTAGQIARNSSALNDFKAYRFFTSINTSTGAPIAFWGFNGNNSEAFTLSGNNVKSSFSVGQYNIENIKNSWVSGLGLAYRAANGGLITPTTADTLFFPVTASTATATSLGAGWHLVTVQAAQANPGSLGNTSTDNTAVGMIIEAGSSRNSDAAGDVRSNVRTWIRGATDNSLTALQAGKAYFVYLNAADSTWTGQ